MDLSQQTEENVEYMIETIKKKLKVVTGAAIKSTHFDIKRYEDLKDIYDLVNQKNSFSISEMDAIINELGKLRNQ